MVISRDRALSRARWWLQFMHANGIPCNYQFVEDSLTDLLVAISEESQDEQAEAE